MEFWPALLASRVGYSAFKLQQPETFSQLLDNLVNAMCLASEEALAINLHTLYMVRASTPCQKLEGWKLL